MIYNNQGGSIGFSSSTINQTKKKLFTPIKISIPILSEVKNYKEKSLPNTPRKENPDFKTTQFPTRKIKTKFILPKKNSNSTGNSPIKKRKTKKEDSKKVNYIRRYKTKKVNKSLSLFNELYDSLVESIKNNRVNTQNSNTSIDSSLDSSEYTLSPIKKEKTLKPKNPNIKFSYLSSNAIPKILKTPQFNSLEDEAKSMTNTIEIANFYDYTKNCMRIIIELKENKSKASIPNKVKILNPDNHKKLAVFDLDETLIHGVVNITNYKNEKNIISITLPSKKIAKIGVNIRPNWEESIKRIKKLYTIVVYTASHSSYADAVLNFLDPENKYFYNRLYRSNCIDIKLNGKTFYIKDMNIFEDFDPKDILIVDNSVTSFAYDLDNGIPILPYYDAEKDLELLFVAYYFESIYECDDLRVINKEYMKLDYYLNQAIEEYNNESDEESEDDISDDVQKKEKEKDMIEKSIQENNKGVSMKHLLFVKKKSVKNGKRRPSQFVEQFQLDIIKLRTKFSRDEEKKKEL